MRFLFQVPYALYTLLEFFLLFLLFRGSFRKYLVFSVYILFQILSDIVAASAYYLLGFKSSAYRNLYWTGEVSQELLLFLVVITFTYAALEDSSLRSKAAKALGVIFLVTLALPFTMLSHPTKQHGFFSSQWFNRASQIWNFGAAIMNLVLWTALLSSRRRDPQLVTLSIGVGLATASAAIMWGARQWLAPANRWPVDIFMAVIHLASVLLWCWAFRPQTVGHSSSGAPSTGAVITPS